MKMHTAGSIPLSLEHRKIGRSTLMLECADSSLDGATPYSSRYDTLTRYVTESATAVQVAAKYRNLLDACITHRHTCLMADYKFEVTHKCYIARKSIK